MVDRPWQMFLLNPRGLTRHEGDRLLEKAGIGRLSLDVTETEAKGTAKEALRKLRAVDDTDPDSPPNIVGVAFVNLRPC